VKRIVLVAALCLTPVASGDAGGRLRRSRRPNRTVQPSTGFYPHGVAKAKTVVDRTSSRCKVRNLVVDAKTYTLNAAGWPRGSTTSTATTTALPARSADQD
jgi:hypothetical protein